MWFARSAHAVFAANAVVRCAPWHPARQKARPGATLPDQWPVPAPAQCVAFVPRRADRDSARHARVVVPAATTPARALQYWPCLGVLHADGCANQTQYFRLQSYAGIMRNAGTQNPHCARADLTRWHRFRQTTRVLHRHAASRQSRAAAWSCQTPMAPATRPAHPSEYPNRRHRAPPRRDSACARMKSSIA